MVLGGSCSVVPVVVPGRLNIGSFTRLEDDCSAGIVGRLARRIIGCVRSGCKRRDRFA